MNGTTDELAQIVAGMLASQEPAFALLQLRGRHSDPDSGRFGYIVGGPVYLSDDLTVTVPFELPVPADVYMVIRNKPHVLCWFGPRRVSMGDSLSIDLKTAFS
jgi:hypothetical protein